MTRTNYEPIEVSSLLIEEKSLEFCLVKYYSMHSLVRCGKTYRALNARCNGTYHYFQESINVQSRQILKGMQT
jgi:hypothetical protein